MDEKTKELNQLIEKLNGFLPKIEIEKIKVKI